VDGSRAAMWALARTWKKGQESVPGLRGASIVKATDEERDDFA
jgi:hypothetical protein